MYTFALLLLVLSASLSTYGQLLPSEASTLETAWASGDRLANADISLRRGFNLNAPFEHISTDAKGIAATKTVQWERIEVHLPRTASVDHIACLIVAGKCRNLPVGAK